MHTITLEEHFSTPDLLRAIADTTSGGPPDEALTAKLLDLDHGRIADMDSGAVDMQVLSLASAGFETLASAHANSIVTDANDRATDAISKHPRRFAAFANVNLKDPLRACKELDRCINKLGFKGAIVHGTTGGNFLDDDRFLPFWEASHALGVPVYLHPAPPPAVVYDTYYTGLPGDCGRTLSINAWGWHTETGLHTLRLILSGLFDRFPSQQIIIGHMGEGLPYNLARAAGALAPVAKHLERSISDYFHDNFHVTTSGYFTNPPFECAMKVVGIDRLLYAIDYPFSPVTKGEAFLDKLNLTPAERDKFVSGNAKDLLKLPR
jgi:predicted TIM-barrel fold metal-dependent hydrolase